MLMFYFENWFFGCFLFIFYSKVEESSRTGAKPPSSWTTLFIYEKPPFKIDLGMITLF